jgi:hypothetical protein
LEGKRKKKKKKQDEDGVRLIIHLIKAADMKESERALEIHKELIAYVRTVVCSSATSRAHRYKVLGR